jgi:hypothetical protein
MTKRIRLTPAGEPTQPTGAMPAASGHWWSGHEDESERQHRLQMQAYANEEARVRAAHGGRMPSFATTMDDLDGSARYDEPPPRRLDDPPDPHHSPELVQAQPRTHIPVQGTAEDRPELPTVGRPDPYPPAEQRVQIAED